MGRDSYKSIMKKLIPFLTMVIYAATASCQLLSPTDYVAKYKDLAIREMKRMGVPAAITLAQGLLETENGNSELLRKSNNHFGIKCKSNWSGLGVSHNDDAEGECFRLYKDAEESYRDHSNFLRGNDRYSFLFKLDPADYKGWANGLKKAGYATNPKYPDMLIKSIEQFNLQQYSLEAAGEVPLFEPEKYTDDKELPFKWEGDSAVKVTGKTNSNASYAVFSENINSLNGAKCILAKKGTSLLAIATRNDVQLSRLLEFNDIRQDGILQYDQLIFLQKKPVMGVVAVYSPEKDEMPIDAAQKNGMQLQSLLNFNNITEGGLITKGTKLYLQGPAPAWRNNAVPVAKQTTHIVQGKEGLYSISKKYGVTVQQIKDWNHLTSDFLATGQQLIVSQ